MDRVWSKKSHLFDIFQSVVDPGFPRGGANLRRGSTNLLCGNIFAENYMKMKLDRKEGR